MGVDRPWWAFWSSKPASGAKPPRWVQFPHTPAKQINQGFQGFNESLFSCQLIWKNRFAPF